MAYDLTDNVNDSFEFEVSGNKYVMRYPNAEEVEQMQVLAQEKDEIKANAKLTKFLYGFIKPVSDAAPSIEKVMKKQNIKVLHNFQEMIKSEFGVE